MASHTGTFSASGQASNYLLLRVNEKVSVTLTGPFTGKVILERTSNLQGWTPIRSFTGTATTTHKNIDHTHYFVRLRAESVLSGSVGYTIEDVAGDKLWAQYLSDGIEALSVTDEGDLYVLGALFSGGGGGSVTIQTDEGTYPIGSLFSFTSSDGSVTTTGDEVTDEVDFVVDPTQGALATALALLAPKASPTFTTKTTHDYATASTVPYFDANKDLVSSAISPTKLGYLTDVTSNIQAQIDGKQATLTLPLSPGNGGTGVANNAACTTTRSGNFALTQTLTNTTSVTYPTAGTLATLAGSETFTNKTLTAPLLTSPVSTGTIELNPSGASTEFCHVFNDTAKDVMRFFLPGSTADYGQIFLNSSEYFRIQLAGAIDNFSIQAANSTDGLRFRLFTASSANMFHLHVQGSANSNPGQMDIYNVDDTLLWTWYKNSNARVNGAFGTRPHRETSSTTYTIAAGRSGFIADYGSLQASATVTMPTTANSFDGMEIFLAAGANGITALTHSANSGQTLLNGLTSLTNGQYGRWVFQSATTTWYRIG